MTTDKTWIVLREWLIELDWSAKTQYKTTASAYC